MDVVIGTAGHIDHGKTSLIKALTGSDTDRLPEEKERGITIDLGFAELVLGETRVGFIDVPGHERFIKNMLAGATGIEAVLLVVAADEGVMPQTREHLEICSLLNIPRGIVVITKTDLVEEDFLSEVEEDLRLNLRDSFLQSAPIIKISSKTGAGVDELLREIDSLCSSIEERPGDGVTRLPIDRSFSVKGFGTVVTGTLSGGSVSVGEEMELFPSGKAVRIRGVQIHGKSFDTAEKSQRTAVNLSGIDFKDISRGEVLIERDSLLGSSTFDAFVQVLPSCSKEFKSRQRVRVHHGCREVLARAYVIGETGSLQSGESGWVQFRLEAPLAALPGDRFVIRSYSPQLTIAGGEVVRLNAPKFRKKDVFGRANDLARFLHASDQERVRIVSKERAARGFGVSDIQVECGWTRERAEEILHSLSAEEIVSGGPTFFVDAATFSTAASNIKYFIEAFLEKNRHSVSVPISLLRDEFKSYSENLVALAIESLLGDGTHVTSGDSVSLVNRSVSLTTEEEALRVKVLRVIEGSGLRGLKKDELKSSCASDGATFTEIISLLIRGGEVLFISNEFFFSRMAVDGLKSLVYEYADASEDRVIDVSVFKSLTGLSRKYAIPLLEYLDLQKVTVRTGEKRVVLRRSR